MRISTAEVIFFAKGGASEKMDTLDGSLGTTKVIATVRTFNCNLA